MLLWFVIIYWIISMGIGLWAALRVHNSRDYAVAGRSLPIYIVTATVFATWFGSETVLGIPATFLREGLGGVILAPMDPLSERRAHASCLSPSPSAQIGVTTRHGIA